MKTFWLLPIFLIVFTSCKQKHTHHSKLKASTRDDSLPIVQKEKKNAIDKYIAGHTKSVIVLVKIPGKENLVEVKNEQWPDEVEYTYDIYKNTSGKIVFIAQQPFSESGDWDIICKHYFDESGNTYAFFRQESIFDDDVKGGIVRETLLNYYDKNFKNIKQVNKFTDKDDNLIKGKKDQYDFRDYKFNIYKNVNDCLEGYNIKLAN